MKKKIILNIILSIILVATSMIWAFPATADAPTPTSTTGTIITPTGIGTDVGTGVSTTPPGNEPSTSMPMSRISIEQRLAVANEAKIAKAQAEADGNNITPAIVPTPGGIPDYFGQWGNFANSPLPQIDANGNVIPGTGMRKFVDTLQGVGATSANDLGNYLATAHPDTITYPGSDYYEIAAVQFTEKFHSDLPPTTVRGYVQLNNGTNPATNTNTVPPDPSEYLGATIIASSNRPVRIKLTNLLPTTASGGDLFLPVDTSVMGAGTGPNGGTELYTDNRATIHLHGGLTPWVSDGTPHQWIAPNLQTTSYAKGASVKDVPDMPVPPGGSMTFYYTNEQTARLI